MKEVSVEAEEVEGIARRVGAKQNEVDNGSRGGCGGAQEAEQVVATPFTAAYAPPKPLSTYVQKRDPQGE